MPDVIISLFALGLLAGLVKSDLKISSGTYDTLAILLMFAIGLKGGLALHGNWSNDLLLNLGVVTLMGLLVPLALFPLLRHLVRLDNANAASLAAHYGSVSAGTFAVAIAWVNARGMPLAPETTLYLVMLELPAIIVGIMLYRRARGGQGGLGPILHEAMTSRSVLLLIGGVAVGFLYGPQGINAITPLFMDLFPALLAIFLLEMGLCAAAQLRAWRPGLLRVVVFALVVPPVLGVVGLGVGLLLGLPQGSVLVLATLMASASYIAAPAAMRHSVPEADVGLAMLAALGVTFPFNVLIGIPIYHWLLQLATGGF